MELLMIGLDGQLVLHHHLHLLVRGWMIIVMELKQVVYIYMKRVLITDHGMKLVKAGSAYIYEKLIASDGAGGDPPFALIGAFLDDNSNGGDAGSAYIYERDNNRSWNEVSKL
eukprot:214496_1